MTWLKSLQDILFLALPTARNKVETPEKQAEPQPVADLPEKYDPKKVTDAHKVLLAAVIQAKRDLGPADESKAVVVALANLLCDECRFDSTVYLDELLSAIHLNVTTARKLDQKHATRS